MKKAGERWIMPNKPLLSKELVTRCLDAAKGHDGVLPVLPMKDTVYASTDGRRVSSLLNREKIFAGQAPEVGKTWSVFARLSGSRLGAADECFCVLR